MIRVNLLPAEEAARVTERRQSIAVGSIALGVVMFVLIAAHVWQGARFSTARRRLGRLNQEITNLQSAFGDVTRMEQQKRELREKLKVISQLEARKVGPVRILADLSGAAPDKLWLTEFADQAGTLRLTGLGADEQTVADFLRRLGTLPLFRTVDLDETSQVDREGTKLKKFTIRAQVDYGSPAGSAQTASGKPPRKGGKR